MISKLNTQDFLIQSVNHPIVDVRSPAEYDHAHITGAISLPLFSNEERAIIGTLYKQQGREVAMTKGLELYGVNMQRILSDLKNQTTDKQIFVHCWRGGMRSGVVAWMLDLFGFKVSTLNQGYKAFRNWVLSSLATPKKIFILGGKTGSAKTGVIHELRKSVEQVIDLEALAHHKGSAFGDLGEAAPPSQEQFENDLALAFSKLDLSKPVWLEDESQRIGRVNIPNALWEQMREARVFYLDISFEERLKNIVEGYGKFELEKLKAATLRIQKRLGGLETKNAIQFFEEGKIREAFSILLRYYDKVYQRATDQRNSATVIRVECASLDVRENSNRVSLLLKTFQEPKELQEFF